MDRHENARKMLECVEQAKALLPSLYEVLPKNDYYLLNQSLEQAEKVLRVHQ